MFPSQVCCRKYVARASPDHLRFTISSGSPKAALKPRMNLNRSYPVLNITSKLQDHLSGKLTTNGTAAGKFVQKRPAEKSCIYLFLSVVDPQK